MLDAAFTSPLLAPTVATVVSDDCHVLLEVTLEVLPSSKVPVAVIWMVPPGATLPLEGVTAIDWRVGLTKKPRHPAARASTKRPEKAAKTRSFRL